MLTMSIFILKSSRGNAAGGLSEVWPGTRQVGGDESRVSKCALVALQHEFSSNSDFSSKAQLNTSLRCALCSGVCLPCLSGSAAAGGEEGLFRAISRVVLEKLRDCPLGCFCR